MHNLSTVIRFEVIRSLKKKSFWILAISFPLLFAVIFGIVYLSGKTTDDAADNLKNQTFSIVVTDESKLIKPEILASVGASTASADDKQETIDKVKTGDLDAYFYYPTDLSSEKLEIYGKDVGIFDNGRYSSVAKMLLSLSVESEVDESVRAVVQGAIGDDSTMYLDGKERDPIKEMILPGIFLVLLYFLVSVFGNQMLVSTTEEKENRVIEMILTTIEARTLIIGKILSLVLLAFVQAFLMLTPAIIGYLLFHNQLSLPSIDLSSLPIDPLRIGLAVIIFACSFLLVTGSLVFAGAAAPTAKEASGFFSIVLFAILGPLYAVTLFISIPESPIVKFLSLFPFTSSTSLLLRNAVGNLGVGEALLGVLIMFVSAVVVMLLAVRIFRFGALEYSRKLSVKEIFARK